MGCVQSLFNPSKSGTASPDKEFVPPTFETVVVTRQPKKSSKRAAAAGGTTSTSDDEAANGCDDFEKCAADEDGDDRSLHFVEATALSTLAANTGSVAILGTTAKCKSLGDSPPAADDRQWPGIERQRSWPLTDVAAADAPKPQLVVETRYVEATAVRKLAAETGSIAILGTTADPKPPRDDATATDDADAGSVHCVEATAVRHLAAETGTIAILASTAAVSGTERGRGSTDGRDDELLDLIPVGVREVLDAEPVDGLPEHRKREQEAPHNKCEMPRERADSHPLIPLPVVRAMETKPAAGAFGALSFQMPTTSGKSGLPPRSMTANAANSAVDGSASDACSRKPLVRQSNETRERDDEGAHCDGWTPTIPVFAKCPPAKSKSLPTKNSKPESEQKTADDGQPGVVRGLSLPTDHEIRDRDAHRSSADSEERVNRVKAVQPAVAVQPNIVESQPIEANLNLQCTVDDAIRMEAVEHDLTQSKAVEHNVTRSKSIEHDQVQSKSIKTDQIQSEAVEHNVFQSKAVEHNVTQSKSIEHDQIQSKSIKNVPIQSEAVEHNAIQSKTVEHNVTQSKSIEHVTQSKSIENDAIQSEAVEHSAIRSEAIEHDTIRSEVVVHKEIQSNDVEHNITQSKSIENDTLQSKVLRPNGVLLSSVESDYDEKMTNEPKLEVENCRREDKQNEVPKHDLTGPKGAEKSRDPEEKPVDENANVGEMDGGAKSGLGSEEIVFDGKMSTDRKPEIDRGTAGDDDRKPSDVDAEADAEEFRLTMIQSVREAVNRICEQAVEKTAEIVKSGRGRASAVATQTSLRDKRDADDSEISEFSLPPPPPVPGQDSASTGQESTWPPPPHEAEEERTIAPGFSFDLPDPPTDMDQMDDHTDRLDISDEEMRATGLPSDEEEEDKTDTETGEDNSHAVTMSATIANGTAEEPSSASAASASASAGDRAATTIQAMYRGFRARKRVETANAAAAKIQAGFRGYRVRRSLKTAGAASTATTATTTTDDSQCWSDDDQKSVVSVTATAATAATAVAETFADEGDGETAAAEEAALTEAAVKIQARVRGFAARKRLNEEKNGKR